MRLATLCTGIMRYQQESYYICKLVRTHQINAMLRMHRVQLIADDRANPVTFARTYLGYIAPVCLSTHVSCKLGETDVSRCYHAVVTRV